MSGTSHDPQERRADRRNERVGAGLEAFERWVHDQIRNGLAGLERAGATPWTRQAARLVDAQAPGLARRVGALAELPGSAPDWPDALVDALGRLALLVEAWGRIGDLPDDLAETVRGHLGWRTRRDDVLNDGARVRDRWTVIGQVVTDDEDLRSRRTWLAGGAGTALLLEFVYGYGSFEPGLAPGTAVDATLAFYPGALRQRALIAARHGGAEPGRPGGTVEALLHAFASALAADPWTTRLGGVVRDAACVVEGDAWWLTDATGAVPLVGEPWVLLALSGGHPLDVAVEWTGRRATALGAWHDGVWRAVS